ncbi:MAG: HU family DNA-binding protein [Nitrospiria bacterium]
MTKAKLIEAVQKANKDLNKTAIEGAIDSAFSIISNVIKKEGRFAYPGFGVFSVRNRKARKGRNPRTGEIIAIKPSKTVGFRPAPALKRSL